MNFDGLEDWIARKVKDAEKRATAAHNASGTKGEAYWYAVGRADVLAELRKYGNRRRRGISIPSHGVKALPLVRGKKGA